MGKAAEIVRLSNASRGRSAGGLALRSLVIAFAKDQSGATAIEYSLIVSCIFLAIVTAVSLFANTTTVMYDKISTAISNAIR